MLIFKSFFINILFSVLLIKFYFLKSKTLATDYLFKQSFLLLNNIIIYYLMKFVLTLLIILLFSANSAPYDTTFNFVSNADFSIPNQGSGWAIVPNAGAWSQANNQIEIGNVKNYNSRWTSGQLCELDANFNSNIYQIINLDSGYYQLNITWAARQGQALDTSKFSVYLNDVLVQFFTPIDYNIHIEILTVKAIQGNNKLSLRGEGPSNSYGAGIKFVGLYAQNYINNGNFDIPDEHGGWAIVKSAGQWFSYTNEIEIGAGTIYNSVWKTGQISELDANTNVQMYQVVQIPAGKYHLRFNWAARSGVPLASNGFSVFWNGARLTLTMATDYSLHTFAADVEAVCLQNNYLTIQGEGTIDGLGVGVDNVRLWTAV